MKRNFILTIAIIIGLFGSVAANAQTDLKGTYIYKFKEDETLYDIMLKFEREDSIYYSYAYKGYGTMGGKWRLENGLIKVVLTTVDANWTFKLKPKGKDLELTEKLSKTGTDETTPDFTAALPIGTVFKKNPDGPSGPDLTPEDFRKRALKLITSIHGPEDISAKNIERQMKIKVFFNRENRNKYGFGGNIKGAPDWFYNVNTVAENNGKKPRRLDLAFNYQLHEPSNPDMTAICKENNFDAYSKVLQEAGFSTPERRYGVHSILKGWAFTRDKVSVVIFIKGGWEPNVDKCIDFIIISFPSY